MPPANPANGDGERGAECGARGNTNREGGVMPDPNDNTFDPEKWKEFQKEIGIPVVDKFGKAMKTKLTIRHKEKRGWGDVSPEWLTLYLETEIAELKEALIERHPMHIMDEAVDVANLAMMIWDVAQRPKEPADAPQHQHNRRDRVGCGDRRRVVGCAVEGDKWVNT